MPLRERLDEMLCNPRGLEKPDIVSVANHAADLFDNGDRDWARACFGLALLLDGSDDQKKQVKENYLALGGNLDSILPSTHVPSKKTKKKSGRVPRKSRTKTDAGSSAERSPSEKEDSAATNGAGMKKSGPESSDESTESRRTKRRERRRARRRRNRNSKGKEASEPREADDPGQADELVSDGIMWTRRVGRNAGEDLIGFPDDYAQWDKVSNERECSASCSLEKECFGYVYHTKDFSVPWRYRCVHLDRNKVKFNGRLSPDTWPRQDGVVSALRD